MSGLRSLFRAVFTGQASEPVLELDHEPEPETPPVPPAAIRIEAIQRLNVEIARMERDVDLNDGETVAEARNILLGELDLAIAAYMVARVNDRDQEDNSLLDSLAYVIVSASVAALLTRGDDFNDVLDDNVAQLSERVDEIVSLDEATAQGC